MQTLSFKSLLDDRDAVVKQVYLNNSRDAIVINVLLEVNFLVGFSKGNFIMIRNGLALILILSDSACYCII